MDFELANQLADRISRGENSGLHKKLISLCMPYLFYVQRKFGYDGIPSNDVKKDLAPSAVDLAISIKAKRGKPFTICLQNTFRDCCRELQRIIRERYFGDITTQIDEAEVELRDTLGIHKQISPIFEAQKKEEMEAVREELQKHERFSKKVVIRKMKGSTYQEMSLSFNEPYNECKRVFWHNLNAMRKNLQNFYKEEDLQTK